MTPPTPTRLHIDPPMDQWRAVPRNGRSTPIIATGHQPTLWHPGILAKDVAAAVYAKRVGGTPLHVVVAHNPVGPAGLDLPSQQGDTLGVRHLVLDQAPPESTLPPNRLQPIDAGRVAKQISEAITASAGITELVRPGLALIAEAYARVGTHTHRAAQTSAVLAELKRPYAGVVPTRTTSELVTPSFVDRLLVDPVGCVRCYNRAAAAFPDAGIRPLYAGRDVVEAPLWAQGDGPSTPVFIDLGDSRRPQLFTQGQTLDLTVPDAINFLRPRAIALSALMRSEHCDLFIHGTGGGVYDQVTERWWRDWVGEPLAPMAVVSADVYLPFAAPVATRDELHRAVWFDHHLPFNVDRFTRPRDDDEAALFCEKHELLDHMNDDRSKRRRSAAFRRVHAINASLRERHAERLAEAQREAERASVGVRNAAIARRRDWCFALYPPETLHDLRQAIDGFAGLRVG